MPNDTATHNFEQRISLIAVMLGGAFLAILNQTLLVTATPHVMAEFNLSENAGQWITTIFMLVNGIMIPITALLMETFTTRRLFMTSMFIFSFGTIVCLLSTNFSVLMVGRVIQASGAGIIMPLMMTVMMLIFPKDKRGFAMGMAGLVIGFAPGIGPTLSGWIIDVFPWRSLFLIVLPLAILDIILAYFFMRNVISRTFPKVDIPSVIFSVFGFGGLLYSFSSVGDYGWSYPPALLAFGIGIVTLTVFIIRQLKLREPILEFRVLTYGIYALTMVISMIAFMMLIAAETILPIYMQVMAGFSAFESGLVILPGALLMGVMSPVVGTIFDKIGARGLLITGFSIVVVTTFFFTRLTEETTLLYLIVVFAIRMFGISMLMMPSTTAGLNELPDSLMPHGTALTNTMRQIAASIGTAILVTVMSLTANETTSGHAQGAIDGVNTAFYTATGISFIGLILSLFIRKNPRDSEKDKTDLS